MSGLWVRQIPVISTGHMPRHTALLEAAEHVPGLKLACYGEGDFLYVGALCDSEALSSAPEWLQPVCIWLWRTFGESAAWICFDRDGDSVESLAEWSW